uniref:Anaphase-promoting complex subunit 4 WD40 domain-containing protein n=1 Tax=Hemiselmis andersenii TaxID=464988 RepID=A0A6U2JGS8_HEMAN|mmetsp:Transcript_9265/g.21657  ORF Transcript_9265/g.21657 Transcript_9265/m.21657 type:complete len:281 (+) Transcript_9265:558-1400(+)
MQIVNCCRWAPDGSAIISGSSDRCIRGWRLQDNGDGDMSKFKWGNGTVLEFAFGDCSSSLAEEHKDTDEFQRLAFKRREHLPNMRCLLTTMQGHSGSISALDFSPGAGLEGGYIASVGSDMEPHVWDCKKALCIDTAKHSLHVKMTPHRRAALTCAFSPTGEVLATGGQDCSVLLHRVSDGSLLREVAAGDSYVTCVSFMGFDDQARPESEEAYLLVSTGATKIKVFSISDPSFNKTLQQAGRAVNTLALTRRSQAWQGQLGLLIGGGDNSLSYVPKFSF